MIDRYFLAEKKAIELLISQKEALETELVELEEEHSGDEGYFSDYDKVNKASVQKRLKAIDNGKLKIENTLVIAFFASCCYNLNAVI